MLLYTIRQVTLIVDQAEIRSKLGRVRDRSLTFFPQLELQELSLSAWDASVSRVSIPFSSISLSSYVLINQPCLFPVLPLSCV